jgi:hypothetical protein
MRVGYLVGGGLHGVSATWPSSAAPPHLKLRTWVARWARIRQPDHRMQSNEVSITGTQEPRRHMLRRWPTALGVSGIWKCKAGVSYLITSVIVK